MRLDFKQSFLSVLLAGTFLVWLYSTWPAEILLSMKPTAKSARFGFREKNDTGGRKETVMEERLSQVVMQPMENGQFHYETDEGRYLIYECTPKQVLCGGLADRQRGLVSTFLLAIVTKRTFKIAMTAPCDLSTCFLPNRYNWTLDTREVISRNTTIRRQTILDKSKLDVDTMDFNAKYLEDVIFLTTNKALHWRILKNERYKSLVPSWAMQPWHVFLKAAWNILMKPSAVIQERVTSFLSSVGYEKRKSPLVAVHIRIGASPSMRDTIVRYNVSMLGELWTFLASYVDKGSELFIATDNTDVRKMSRARFGQAYHEAAKVIRHIDQNRAAPGACLAFQDVVVDQQILTHGDVLLMTRSGFGETAAVLRGSNSSLYKFYREGGVRAEDLATTYVARHL